jgi:hypothetical protein
MSLGNVGGVLNILEGALFTDLANTGTTNLARSNQGVAMLAQLVRMVATRADFSNLYNLKVYLGYLANSSSPVSIETVATQGVLAVAWDNSDSVDGYLCVYGVSAPTHGTTQQAITIYMPTVKQGCMVFPQPVIPVTNTGLAWDVTTNVTPGATASTSSKVSVAIVYAK